MTWAELVTPWPLDAYVRSRVDDGVWVKVGMTGYIVGREQRDNDLMVTVTWDNDTQTRVWAREIERTTGYHERRKTA